MTLTELAADIAHASREGVEIGIVVGGGNFFRGVQGLNKGLDRTADSIGMLGTVMNALALEHAIEAAGAPARAMSAVPMPSLCESYARKRALHHLSNGKVVILGGGTGNP
ncbi:amino acid kinase family protein, partial [Bosea thiooxidans]